MGSIFNFIFEKSYNDINGVDFCTRGPLTKTLIQKYSTTTNLKLREGYKNILFYEVQHPHEFLDYILSKKNICRLLDRDDFKILFAMIPDPSTEDWYNRFQSNVLEKLKGKVIFIDTNVAIKNIYTFHFFLEQAVDYVDSIFKEKSPDYFQEDLKYKNEPIHINELDNFRNKKFLSFNRVIQKYHRYRLFFDWGRNDFSDSYFSFLNRYEGGWKVGGNAQSEMEKHYGADYCEKMFEKLPIELDTQEVERDGKIVMWSRTHNNFKKELFLNSCINIVTETSFQDNELFISEKILKPIIGYQPFIVLGPQNYLKELKKLGFKTFSHIWDESYDSIESASKRYERVIKLILDLNKKSIDELNKIYKSVKDICIYNRNHIKKLNNDSLTKIFNNIENNWNNII